jgi:hypothetical protein
MKKILSKWYLTLIVVPIFLTYLTNYFTLPKILEDWKTSIIFSITILSIILIIQVKLLKEELAKLRNRPNESDIKIIEKLLKKLNVKSFEEDICKNDAWNGYPQKSIHNITDYQYAARSIINKTTDKKLNQLLAKFNKSLEDFTDFTSCHVYGHEAGFLIPFKHDNRARAEIDSVKMNKLSLLAFMEFEILIAYLKDKKYI